MLLSKQRAEEAEARLRSVMDRMAALERHVASSSVSQPSPHAADNVDDVSLDEDQDAPDC